MNLPLPGWLPWLLIAIGVFDLGLAWMMRNALAKHPEAVTPNLRRVATFTQVSGLIAVAVGVGLLLFLR